MAIDLANFRHDVRVTRTKLATWDPAAFKRAYRARGLTLQQVAVRSGIPYSAVRTYSSGTATPPPPRLTTLARVLAITTGDLAPLRTAETRTLHELRWHAGLTVAQLAAAVGYSTSHTSLVMAGVSPITEPERWTRALGVPQQQVECAWAVSRSAGAGAGSEAE